MARQLHEIIADARGRAAERDKALCCGGLARSQTSADLLLAELCEAAEQTDRWLVDAHVRAAREQDEASAERAALVNARNEALKNQLASGEAFRTIWAAFGETVKQRDAAVLALNEIRSKSTDASARTIAEHALKLAQFDETDHGQGAA